MMPRGAEFTRKGLEVFPRVHKLKGGPLPVAIRGP
jgi:hypothetical protein